MKEVFVFDKLKMLFPVINWFVAVVTEFAMPMTAALMELLLFALAMVRSLTVLLMIVLVP